MDSYDRRIARAVTKADLEPWAADLRRMTKIYRSIPTAPEDQRGAIFAEARSLFMDFGNHFQEWVYRTLLPSVAKDKFQSWSEQEVRKKAWDAIISLRSDMFPSSWNHKTDTFEDAPYEVARKIDTNVRRYQRAFIIAFKAIEEYIADEERRKGGPVERREMEEHYDVAGISVHIHSLGRDDYPEYEHDVDEFLRALGDFARRIDRAGFSAAVRGLTVEVAFADPGTLSRPTDLTAGVYHAEKDSMTVYPLGFIRSDGGTFTHECGHRFWFRELSPNARAHWNEVMESRMTVVTKADVDEFTDRYLAKHPDLYTTELVGLVDHTEGDEEKKAKFTELAQWSRPVTVENAEIDKLRDILMKRVGDKVHLENISDYARESPVEAFAEAFRFYVLKGPHALGPWTREFFSKIVRSGGAKLAQRILARYLAAPV